jgi:rSAM/selenodomain-associated transferase 2
MVSVIIPTYNEEEAIGRALECLRVARGSFEVLVADGGSDDGTRAQVEAIRAGFPHPLRLVVSKRNRACQLNCAARLAGGDILLFLHADALFPPEAVEALETALRDESIIGGNFNLRYEGPSGWNEFFSRANRVRRRFGIYYGDSGIFVRREVFHKLGGFPTLPVMDDYEFIRRMERAGRTVCLAPVIAVSDRRWRTQGALKTVLSWAVVQGLYSLGVPAKYLESWYPLVRNGAPSREALEASKVGSPAGRAPYGARADRRPGGKHSY